MATGPVSAEPGSDRGFWEKRSASRLWYKLKSSAVPVPWCLENAAGPEKQLGAGPHGPRPCLLSGGCRVAVDVAKMAFHIETLCVKVGVSWYHHRHG